MAASMRRAATPERLAETLAPVTRRLEDARQEVERIVGSLVGRMYAESDKGPVAFGRITCPAMIKIGEDGAQRGTGHCVIVAGDGAKIYAELTCAGAFMVGCDGELKITGGSDRFEKVTGQGPALVRSDQRIITVQSEVTSTDEATGILYLRGFRYKTP